MALALGFAGCATSREPPNLGALKQQVIAYVESGDYERDLAKVAGVAQRWIEHRAAAGGSNLTVVFDLDETLLMNFPHIRSRDFGYVPAEWKKWVENAKAPPIGPVRDVYRTARRLGVGVVFLTGRYESSRADTVRNLQAIDCGSFSALICKPDGQPGSAAGYKTAAREKLVAEGRVIIANLGDQQSDLTGGFAEKTFKLPNPFYQID